VWAILTHPVSFPIYTFKYNLLWYGWINAIFMTSFYPLTPVTMFFFQILQKIKSLFVTDWMMSGPGRVFFVKPEGFFASFIWDCYISQSMFVGQFWLVGTQEDAIQHTWYDTILTKDFWRKTLNDVNARVPRAFGYWDGSTWKNNYPGEQKMEKSDIVIKVNDSYLGIGDLFWYVGKDFKTEADIVNKLKADYVDKVVFVLELVRPKKELGVHSVDVLTMRTPDDDVKVFSVLLWTDCTTDSSHSTRAGYVIDCESEMIVSAADWYSPFFTTMKKPLIGTKFPGVKKAC